MRKVCIWSEDGKEVVATIVEYDSLLRVFFRSLFQDIMLLFGSSAGTSQRVPKSQVKSEAFARCLRCCKIRYQYSRGKVQELAYWYWYDMLGKSDGGRRRLSVVG
jgi:hypothetical protein